MWELIPKKVFVGAMMLSGMLGGMAGCIEVLGVHGYFLNNFATGLGSNGMLAALIVKNNMVSTPFMAFFLAVLKIRVLWECSSQPVYQNRWLIPLQQFFHYHSDHGDCIPVYKET